MKYIKKTLILLLIIMLGVATKVKALSHDEPFVDTNSSAPSDFVKTLEQKYLK